MKYFANFVANNGTTFLRPLEGNNKNELAKAVRDAANAERFYNNICRWWVRGVHQHPDDRPIICGFTDRLGIRHAGTVEEYNERKDNNYLKKWR